MATNNRRAEAWGWTAHEETHWNSVPAELIPARVTGRYSVYWRVVIPAESREETVQAAGAFRYLAAGSDDYPVVGDWVALSPDGGLIQQILPRRSSITRRQAGRAACPQLLAANVEMALLVFGLDGGRNFSPGLLERFLTLCSAGGVAPLVVLNKADLAQPDYIETVRLQTAAVRSDIPVCITSTRSGAGLLELHGLITAGRTTCCMGRSGVGKSSIMNALLGTELRRTAEVSRIQNKGRHTTSTAQLLMLPGAAGDAAGGMLIDTPGLREVQLWGGEHSLLESFADVRELAAGCRFRDCRHQGEPGCAVQRAVAEGALPLTRLEHYLEQRDELAEAETRRRLGATAQEKQKWKSVSKRARRDRR